jgi:2-iminoacetate synthase ThiH
VECPLRPFSKWFEHVNDRLEELARLRQPLRPVEEILAGVRSGGGLNLEDAASLVACASDPSLLRRFEAAGSEHHRAASGGFAELVIPVYLTSYCQNDCLYCGYRQGNALAERTRLDLDRLGRELDLLIAWGHRQIELVLSDDPDYPVSLVAACINLTRRKLQAAGGGKVALCSPVYEAEDYRCLREAGVDWLVEWQETYHQPHFDRWHFPGSPKRHFEERLDLWDTTISAGLSNVGLGVLLGLYDWRFDVLAVIEHGEYLRRTYGIEPYAIGFPRLKPARGVLASQKPSRFTVSDEEFRLIISLYHLAFPHSRLFFNTREPYELNLSLVTGGDLFTVDCETLPGAYLRRHLPGQFSTHYYPPRGEVAATLLREKGLKTRYLAAEVHSAVEPQADHVDPQDWKVQHQQVKSGLQSFKTYLERLESPPPAAHGEMAVELLGFMKVFAAGSMTHCRGAETLFAAALDEQARAELLRQHERFGTDLDKFARQIRSYRQSGDPTVLVTMGNRMHHEYRDHLRIEGEMFRRWSAADASPALSKPGH